MSRDRATALPSLGNITRLRLKQKKRVNFLGTSAAMAVLEMSKWTLPVLCVTNMRLLVLRGIRVGLGDFHIINQHKLSLQPLKRANNLYL